jgi:hypothetical protein
MAASIWVLSKPMASMFAMASARSEPIARPEGVPVERLGVGVAGGAAAWVADWAGAGGAAGVLAAAGGAGVAGGGAAAAAAAGAGLGYVAKG